MKRMDKAFFVALAIVAGMVGIPPIINWGKLQLASESSRRMAAINKAGGLDRLNADIVKVLERYGTNETDILNAPKLLEFPTIAALGDSALITVNSKCDSPYINLRSGTHFNYQIYMLFMPGSVPSAELRSNLLPLSSNIFYVK